MVKLFSWGKRVDKEMKVGKTFTFTFDRKKAPEVESAPVDKQGEKDQPENSA